MMNNNDRIRRLQLHNTKRLIAALPEESRLREKLQICATDSLGYFSYCRQPSCAHCRRRYVARQYKMLSEKFGHALKADMAFVSIVLDVARSTEEIITTIAQARTSMRNIVAKHRKKSKKWNGVEFTGWFEIDAVASDYLPLIGTKRSHLLSQLGVISVRDEPTFVPTIHGVVSLNGLDYQQFRDALEEKWHHPFQVDVRPFYGDSPMEKSLRCCIQYALKRTYCTSLCGIEEHWPDKWLVDFEEWHFGWSRGFQSMKLSIGKRNEKQTRWNIAAIHAGDELEPMYNSF